MTFITAQTQDQSIDLGAILTGWVQTAGEYVGLSQTFRLTTGLDTRSDSFSIGSSSFLNTLAAASLASGHRSAPRFS